MMHGTHRLSGFASLFVVIAGCEQPPSRDILNLTAQTTATSAVVGVSRIDAIPKPVDVAQFGRQVALGDDVLLVTSPAVGANEIEIFDDARIHVFVRSGEDWTPSESVVIDPPARGAPFATRLVLDGDTALLGSTNTYTETTTQARVIVLARANNSFEVVDEILDPLPGVGTGFAHSVALEGDFVVVGAPSDPSVAPAQGSVFLYIKSESGFSLVTHVLPPVGFDGTSFGSAVALRGGLLAVVSGEASSPKLIHLYTVSADGVSPAGAIPFDEIDGRPMTHISIDDGRVLVGRSAPCDEGPLLLLPTPSGHILGPPIELPPSMIPSEEESCSSPGECVPNCRIGMNVAFVENTIVTSVRIPSTFDLSFVFFDLAGETPAYRGLFDAPFGTEIVAHVSARGAEFAVGSALDDAYVVALDDVYGGSCDDDSDCTQGSCVDGVCCDTSCGNNDPNDCLACSVATGAPVDGLCAPTSGNACDDGDVCTLSDACVEGACSGAVDPCDDEVESTLDACDSTHGCTHQLVGDPALFTALPNADVTAPNDIPSAAMPQDGSARAVAIDGDVIAIRGRSCQDDGAGSSCAITASIFERESGAFSLVAEFEFDPRPPAWFSYFGRFDSAIAVADDLVLVGVPNDMNSPTAEFDSVVHVLRRVVSGWVHADTWNFDGVDTPANSSEASCFGRSIAIEGDHVVIGTPCEAGPGGDPSNLGALYRLELDETVTPVAQRIGPLDEAVVGSVVNFADSVDVRGATIVASQVGTAFFAVDVEESLSTVVQEVDLPSDHRLSHLFWASDERLFVHRSKSFSTPGEDLLAVYSREGDQWSLVESRTLPNQGTTTLQTSRVSVANHGDRVAVTHHTPMDARLDFLTFVEDHWVTGQPLAGLLMTADDSFALAMSEDTLVAAHRWTSDVHIFSLDVSLGAPCDDDVQCTQGFCRDGVCCDSACGDGDLTDCLACSTATGAAVDGVCSPSTGNSCDDGDACTLADTCLEGACTGAIDSCDDENPCTVDTCDVEGCEHVDVADGVTCDDGNPCTDDDRCTAGVCGGDAVTCVAVCQLGTCGADGACSFTPIEDGAACTVSSACGGAGTCTGGVCSTTAPICDDANPCTLDACMNATECSHQPLIDAAPCPGGACFDGKCVPTTTDAGASPDAGAAPTDAGPVTPPTCTCDASSSSPTDLTALLVAALLTRIRRRSARHDTDVAASGSTSA